MILPLEDDRVSVWVLEISLSMAMSALTKNEHVTSHCPYASLTCMESQNFLM